MRPSWTQKQITAATVNHSDEELEGAHFLHAALGGEENKGNDHFNDRNSAANDDVHCWSRFRAISIPMAPTLPVATTLGYLGQNMLETDRLMVSS